MIQTTPQAMGALEDTDTAFHTGVPFATSDKPRLPFVLFACFGAVAGFGQDDMLNAHLFSFFLVVCRIYATVGTGLLGRAAKLALMRLQTGEPLFAISWIAI